MPPIAFNPQGDYQRIELLSSHVALQQGIVVERVRQAGQDYILKSCLPRASAMAQADFAREQACYRRFAQQTFCLPYQQIDEHKLCLAYAKPLMLAASSLTERIAVFKQLVRQVQQLHQLSYVHGDLKWAHLLCDQQQIKLVDFAQTRYLNELTNNKTRSGTPSYMAPERFQGQPCSVQSDIYALGVIFYQFLTGHKPYHAKSYYDWAIQHCQTAVPQLAWPLQRYQAILDLMLAKTVTYRAKQLAVIIQQLDEV